MAKKIKRPTIKAAEKAQHQTEVPEKKPKAAGVPEAAAPTPITQPMIRRDAETREITGVTLPNGRTIMTRSIKDIEAIIGKQVPPPTPAGAVEAEEVIREQRIQQQIAETPLPKARELEETSIGAFKEAEIFPKKSLFGMLEDTPLGQAVFGQVRLKTLKQEGKGETIIAMTDYMLENGLRPDQVTDDPATQMVLSLELNENDLKILRSGKADVGDFALLIEGVPWMKKTAGFLGKGIVPTTADERLEEVQKKVNKLYSDMRDWRMAAARNPIKANEYLDLINDAEIEIRNAESTIKLLLIQSSYYQNSPEKVQNVQEDIDDALKKVGDTRNAILLKETPEQAAILG